MKKLVNGQLVDLTAEEISAKQAEEALAKAQQISTHLNTFSRSYSEGKLTHSGFSEDFTKDQRYEVKQTIDFLERLGENAPETITWFGTYGDQTVSLETLIGWMMAGGLRRQKRFNVVSAIDPANYTELEDLEAAFVAAMEA